MNGCMITLNILWIPVTKYTLLRFGVFCDLDWIAKMESTRRTSWLTNNAIPDSIIMNMICRSLVFSVEPKVRLTETALTSKNTLRILNTIKPVTRAFTAMDNGKLVRVTVIPQAGLEYWPCTNVIAPFCASQVARDDKLKSAYQMKIAWNWLTQGCDCQEWRNDHNTEILTPHNPTSVDLWRIIKRILSNVSCVLEYIGRWSHNNQLLSFGKSKGEITLAISQFEVQVETIVY